MAFPLNPTDGQEYINVGNGRTKTCENHEERAIATLVSLMATLISLKSNFPLPAP